MISSEENGKKEEQEQNSSKDGETGGSGEGGGDHLRRRGLRESVQTSSNGAEAVEGVASPRIQTSTHPDQIQPVKIVAREEPARKSLARRIVHWGPLLALGVISEISISTLICALEWWPPMQSIWALLNLLIFLFWVSNVVSNLIGAAYVGPGFVPLGWKPDNEADELRVQYCSICLSYKAPRSHHCRKCGRCVKKMDHHCPWINNCVGFENQPMFMKFLLSAVIGCTHSLFILGPAIYRAVFVRWHMYYEIPPIVDLGIFALLAAIFGFGLAVGVIVSVGFLFCVQLLSVCRNRTGIEDYILKKAAAIRRRRKNAVFDYPYDIGWRRSLAETFTWSGRPKGNGIWWTLRSSSTDGSATTATQFTFSEEQLRQKAVKRRNAVEYVTVREYGGRMITCWHGCKTCCCTPWSDEPRIQLKPGDRVMVTRWAKCWLYGEMADGKRGWFPENVVRAFEEVVTDNSENEDVGDDDREEIDASLSPSASAAPAEDKDNGDQAKNKDL